MHMQFLFIMLVMNMRMGLGASGTEQPANLVRSQIGYDLIARTELAVDILDAVRAHNALHDLAVDRQRHIHRRTLDHSRPMLIAYGVSQLDGSLYDRLGSLPRQGAEIDHHDLVKAYAYGRYPASLRIVINDVAVGDLPVSLQGHRIAVATVARRYETALLRRPLVKLYILHLAAGYTLFPLG